jgi:hypothetical protein
VPDLSPKPPAQPQRSTKPKAGPVAFLVVAVLIIIGVVNSGKDEPATSSSDSRPAAAAEPDAGQDAQLPESGAAEPGADAALTDGGAAETAVVPDVVGMNHQLAQDTLQASGFYLLLEEDATGQGRMLILDRNWEVVSQSVPAGTQAPLTAPITLYSKKIGE